jgi:hypothetical protein
VCCVNKIDRRAWPDRLFLPPFRLALTRGIFIKVEFHGS